MLGARRAVVRCCCGDLFGIHLDIYFYVLFICFDTYFDIFFDISLHRWFGVLLGHLLRYLLLSFTSFIYFDVSFIMAVVTVGFNCWRWVGY